MSESYLGEDSGRHSLTRGESAKILVRFIKPFLPRYLLAFSLLISSSVCVVLSATRIGALVEALRSHGREIGLQVTLTIVALELCAILCSFLGRITLAFAASRTSLSIREALFQHLEELPLEYFDRQPLGRTVTRVSHDVEGMEDFFSSSLGAIAGITITTIVAGIGMLTAAPVTGAVLLATLAPAVVVTLITRRRAQTLNREIARRNSAINARLSEYLQGIGVVRAFGLEDWSLSRVEARVADHQQTHLEYNAFNARVRPLLSLLCQLPLFTLLIFGGRAALMGSMSVGLIVTLARLCERVSKPLDQLSREIHVVQVALASIDRVIQFLSAPKERQVLGDDGTKSALGLHGAITFTHVTMGYEQDRPVLRDLSFQVRPGERIGLVGATGSGKSSTVALLARLYEFQLGTITLDGEDIRNFSRDSLRSALGFVSQDVIIFRGSVRENLAVGTERSDSALDEICQQTGLDVILRERELTLDSLLLDHGANISVGERQLIALTRVLVQQPSVLILDEATAHIDPHHESLMQHAIDTVMKGRTCLVIAHRLQTVAQCDRLLVFKNGEIIEQGNHEALVQRRGYYFDLVQGRVGDRLDGSNNTASETVSGECFLNKSMT